MARPPRIPNWLPESQPTLYFVTFCSAGRAKVLVCDDIFEKFTIACEVLKGLWILSAVVMPDHIYLVMAPMKRDASVKNAVAGLKKGIRQPDVVWKWQEGCFDRLLRNDESAQQKWEYMREKSG